MFEVSTLWCWKLIIEIAVSMRPENSSFFKQDFFTRHNISSTLRYHVGSFSHRKFIHHFRFFNVHIGPVTIKNVTEQTVYRFI